MDWVSTCTKDKLRHFSAIMALEKLLQCLYWPVCSPQHRVLPSLTGTTSEKTSIWFEKASESAHNTTFCLIIWPCLNICGSMRRWRGCLRKISRPKLRGNWWLLLTVVIVRCGFFSSHCHSRDYRHIYNNIDNVSNIISNSTTTTRTATEKTTVTISVTPTWKTRVDRDWRKKQLPKKFRPQYLKRSRNYGNPSAQTEVSARKTKTLARWGYFPCISMADIKLLCCYVWSWSISGVANKWFFQVDCNLAIVEKKLRATGSNPWLLDIHAIGWSFTIDSVHNMVTCLLRTRIQVKKKGFLI